MQDLKFHELADVFPLLGQEQLQELATDIKANGLRESITLFEDQILDGRNRYNAAKLSGYDIKSFLRFEGTTDDAVAFVISKNIHRRHLTNDQRAMIAAELYEKLPKPKVGGDRKPLSQTCDNRNSEPSADNQKEKVAKQMRVSVRGIERASAIQNKDFKKAAEVKAGTKTIKQAEKEMKPKEPSQGPRKDPQEDQIVDLSDAGLTLAQVAERVGRTPRATRQILEDGRLRRSSSPPPVSVSREELSSSARDKFDAAIRQEVKRLQQKYEIDVATEVDKRVRHYLEAMSKTLAKEREEYKRVMAARNGFLTKAAYNLILKCVHEDRQSDPVKKQMCKDATIEFLKLEKCILNEKESPTPMSAPLPNDMKDWEELKRKAKVERAARRKARKDKDLEAPRNQ